MVLSWIIGFFLGVVLIDTFTYGSPLSLNVQQIKNKHKKKHFEMTNTFFKEEEDREEEGEERRRIIIIIWPESLPKKTNDNIKKNHQNQQKYEPKNSSNLKKIDWVSPADNRPFTDYFDHL